MERTSNSLLVLRKLGFDQLVIIGKREPTDYASLILGVGLGLTIAVFIETLTAYWAFVIDRHSDTSWSIAGPAISAITL